VIRADGNAVTFHLDVPGLTDASCLVIRCDADGNAWASIAAAPNTPSSPSN
jgi:hypothetical protein